MKIAAALAPLAALAFTGCMVERDYQPAVADEALGLRPADPAVIGQGVTLGQGHLAGDLGEVRALDAEATRLSGFSDGTMTTAEVVATRPNGGSAMAIVTLDGDLRDPRLREGVRVRLGEESDVYVDVLGCSGAVEGQWSTDVGADEVEIVVEPVASASVDGEVDSADEVDERVRVRFTGLFATERDGAGAPLATDVLSGSFVVALPR